MNKNELETRLAQVENRMECLKEELDFYELEKIQLECCLRDITSPRNVVVTVFDDEYIDNEPYFYGKDY